MKQKERDAMDATVTEILNSERFKPERSLLWHMSKFELGNRKKQKESKIDDRFIRQLPKFIRNFGYRADHQYFF